MKKQPITKEELVALIGQGYSSYKIAKTLNRGPSTIVYWLKKYNLKTNCKARGMSKEFMAELNKKRFGKNNITDWSNVQKLYDSGKTIKEILSELNFSYNQLSKAKLNGLFVSRTPAETCRITGRKFLHHTEESKRRMSNSRKIYLSNTNQKAWKTHDHFKSIPCEWLKTELINRGILFESEFEPLLHKKRFFAIDIAFPKVKFGIEINGGQHYDTNGNLKPYYQNRHDLIVQDGWEIWEIRYHETKSVGFLKKVLGVLKEKLVVAPGLEPGQGTNLVRFGI